MKEKVSWEYPLRQFGAAAAVVLICAGLVYWHLSAGIYLQKGFAWDEPIMLALHSLSRPWLDQLFYWITQTAGFLAFIPALAMFIYLWRRSEQVTAVLYVAAAILFPLLSLVLKDLFARPRQEIFTPLVLETTYSYPSGHTLTATAIYGLAAVLLWQRGHRALALLSGTWVVAIMVSRVYLGAHYPSDVLASLASGIILIVIFVVVDGRLNAYLRKRGSE